MTASRALTLLILVGFVSIAVFGAFSMGQSAGTQNACIAMTALGIECVTSSDIGSVLARYLGAFASFSSAFFVAVYALILVSGVRIGDVDLSAPTLSHALSTSRTVSPKIGESLRSWISLHEHSPSA